MTFDEVMEKVQAKGNENQELLKTVISSSDDDNAVEIGLWERVFEPDYYCGTPKFIVITSEQFLKIYEILGE